MTETRCKSADTFVGYLDDFMSVLGISKCFGNFAVGQMLLSPQSSVTTCTCNVGVQVGCLKPDAFWSSFCCYFAT